MTRRYGWRPNRADWTLIIVVGLFLAGVLLVDHLGLTNHV
jgi:hypothetical protein